MDIDISSWILEFVIQQPVPDTILDSLFQSLPIPNNNCNTKKALILRKIESEISNGSVTEKLLELLELFEELDFQQGIGSLDDMKSAYCAVAVECTVKFLNKILAGNDKGKYYEAVRRIWKRRINLLGNVEYNVGIVSDELWEWRDEIEAALLDDRFCEKVMRRSEGVCAVDEVKGFIRGAKERMVPPFLEIVAEIYMSDDAFRASLGGVDKEGSCRDNEKEVHKGNTLTKKKHVALRHTRGASTRTFRGVRITDSVRSRLDAAGKQDDILPTPEIEGAVGALKMSSLELRAVVKDPLPDALKLAETLVARDNVGNQPATDPNLMNQKSAAHTSEQDDSTEDSSQGSPSGTKSFTLPSPKRMENSPLKKYEFKKITTRRKSTKWSTLEEDTLRAGVQKYGCGNWKLILDAYRDIFAVRTAVDLKDKWRNLMP